MRESSNSSSCTTEEKSLNYPSYTAEDMKKLHALCREGSPLDDYFHTNGYNPAKLHYYMSQMGMVKERKVLFETERKDLLNLVNRNDVSTYVEYRLMIKK